MPNRNTLDADGLSSQTGNPFFKGRDVKSLGPSDSSDTGADLIAPALSDDDPLELDGAGNEDSEGSHLYTEDAGASIEDLSLEDTSDRNGTGGAAGLEPDVHLGADIAPDRIVEAEEAGLGGGLDQAEEARLGITDEEIAEMLRQD